MLRKREFIEIHSSAIEFSYYRKWNRKSQQHFIWWWFHGGGINLITQSICISIWSDADEINVPNAESTKSEMLCANDWEIESGLSVFYIYVYIWGGCVIHCIGCKMIVGTFSCNSFYLFIIIRGVFAGG